VSRWYYSSNGKAEGPVDETFIIEQLKSAKLNLLDLVFKEGDTAWRTIGEIPQLRISNEPKQQMSDITETEKPLLSQVGWVVLKPRDGGGFVQHGPYSAEQIIEQISDGRVHYSQYTWRPGYRRWVRIGNLPEFDRRLRDRENDSVNQVVPFPEADGVYAIEPTFTAVDLLGSVHTAERIANFKTDLPPPETNGVNLASDPVGEILESVAPQIPIEKAKVPELRLDSRPNILPVPELKSTDPRSIRTTQLATRLFIAGIGTGLTVVFAIHISNRHKSDLQKTEIQNTSDAIPKEKISETSPVVPASLVIPPTAKQLVAPPLPSASPPIDAKSEAPSVLEISAIKLNSSHPQLVFQTDMPPGQNIVVKVIGRPGQILSRISYRGRFTIARQPGEVATLDLSKEELPEGHYSVIAQASNLEATKTIFIGTSDPAGEVFKKNLASHTKSIASRIHAEKNALFYSSRDLAKLSDKFYQNYGKLKSQPKQWKAYYSDWTAKRRIAIQPVRELIAEKEPFAFPAEFEEYKAALLELTEKAAQLSGMVTTRNAFKQRGTASAVPVLSGGAFRKLKAKAAALSANLL
jgi:hypothetical protein